MSALTSPAPVCACRRTAKTTNISARSLLVHDINLKGEGHFLRILDAVLYFDEKSDGFFSVDCAVIVTQGQIHHRTDFHFPIHCDGSRHDFVHAKDAALWRI